MTSRVIAPQPAPARRQQSHALRPRFVAGAIGPTPRTASISPDFSDPGAGDRLFKRPFFSQNTPRNTPRRALGHEPAWLLGSAPAR